MGEMVERVAGVIYEGMRNYHRSDEIARAVIAAMREPTEGMVGQAAKEVTSSERTATAVWQEMIDECLK